MESMYAYVSKIFSIFLKIVPQGIIDKVGADKVQHFFAGAIVGLIAMLSSVFFGTSMLAVLVAPAAVGILKELLDWVLNKIAISKGQTPTHGVDFLDALATALGGVAVFAILKALSAAGVAHLLK